MPLSQRVEDLLIVTATVPVGELDSASDIYTSEFAWVHRWSGEVGALGEAWGIGSDRGMTYLAPEAETRGWLRLVEGPTPSPRPLSTWGWNAIEICVADVDGMMEQISASPHFRVNGLPVDLAISDDPPGQRAMQAVGPHGVQTFLTQVLYQIPGMELLTPPPGSRVGGIFISVLAARSYDQSMIFYRDGLGLEVKLEFEYRPTAAREQNWPGGRFGCSTTPNHHPRIHQRLLGRSRWPRNFSRLSRCITVRSPPLAASLMRVEGRSSQLKPRLPKASRCSHTTMLSPSMVQPLGVSPSLFA